MIKHPISYHHTTLYWTEIAQPFNHPLRLDMLLGYGLIRTVQCRLKGQNSRYHKGEERLVVFDKAYVKAWLKKAILENLEVESPEQFSKILEKIWDEEPLTDEQLQAFRNTHIED